jgi:hypothetical protein
MVRFLFGATQSTPQVRACLAELRLHQTHSGATAPPIFSSIVELDSQFRACLGELHAAPDPQKQLHSNFFVPNTPAPKTPDPPNPWI